MGKYDLLNLVQGPCSDVVHCIAPPRGPFDPLPPAICQIINWNQIIFHHHPEYTTVLPPSTTQRYKSRFRSYKYLLISYVCLYHRVVITACLLEHVSTLSHPPFTTQKHIEKLFCCSIKFWLFMEILHNIFLWPNKICWNVMFFPEINFPPFMNLQNLDLMLHKDLCTVKNPETYGSLH